MSNESKNLSKLLCFTDVLCDFADDVTGYEYHDHQFNVEIDDDKFNFDLPELVDEIRKYRQAVIDDIENCSDDEWGDEVADKPKSFFDELFVPDFTTIKTSNDEVTMSDNDEVTMSDNDKITMSDFDNFRQGMPDTVKTMFNLALPLSIIEEAEAHKKLDKPKPKSERIKEIEMHTMLILAQIAVS